MVKVLTHKTSATILALDLTTPITSVPDQFFHSRIKDHQRETCNRTVFKAHRPAQIHLNTRHLPHHQDHQHPVQGRQQAQDFLRLLRTLQARPTMVQLAVVPSAHRQVMDLNLDDLEVPDLLLDHNSVLAAQITSLVAVHLSWALQARRFMDKDILAWADHT